MQKRSAFSRRELLSLTGLAAGAGLVPSFSRSQDRPAGSPALPSGGAQERSGIFYEISEGPWGVLSYYYFYLEAPSHLLEVFPLPNPRTRWAVPVEEATTFRSVLAAAPLSLREREVLDDDFYVGVADGLYAVFPPSEIVGGLSLEARSLIYNYLAGFEVNTDIRNPLRIQSGSIEEWAQGTSMRPDLVRQMEEMSFHRGDLLVFCDFPHLISQAGSESEARALQRHSSRVRSMVVTLDVKKCRDLASLMSFWSTGQDARRKEVEPLVEAAMQTPGVTGLDIAHLLPPLPRKLLHSYPDVNMAIDGIMPDCHWTTLNFFNYNPETIYLDEYFAARRLMDGYQQVEPPYRFGDAIVFVTEEMSAHHSCVYLAGDLVFTKNGRSIYAPWTVQTLEDVRRIYREADEKPLRVQGFRKNEMA